jgi:hypothetical protein
MKPLSPIALHKGSIRLAHAGRLGALRRGQPHHRRSPVHPDGVRLLRHRRHPGDAVAHPARDAERPFLGPEIYNQLFTMHGTVMMFLFAIPLIEGVALYFLPKLLGARDMAFPRLSAFGYWCYLFGGSMLIGRWSPASRRTAAGSCTRRCRRVHSRPASTPTSG